jgi:large subunit ribosomal protein L6
MSRVAKNPIEIPKGVEVTILNNVFSAKGPKGQLEHTLHDYVSLEQEDNILRVVAKENAHAKRSGSKNTMKISVGAMAGTTRALINNIVVGVSQGFERKLLMKGVGYRAQMQGNKLNISAGFSHPVHYDVPEGIAIETPSQTDIVIKGANKQLVGQVAAEIRSIRPPEPYKGKGIRYADEHVVIKETKKK